MNIDWPVAFMIMVAFAACAGVVSEFIKTRARSAQDEASGRYAEQYRILSSNYEALLKETREGQANIQTELAELQKKSESIEKMLKEVG
jgi:uncharacterized protein HemX